MRVSRDKAAENRTALLKAASRLFRRRGIDGVGVAEIAKEAGLTHGALYAHFPSKDDLAAEAFSYGFAGNMEATRQWAGDRIVSFEEYIGGLLSVPMRDMVDTGCPMAASASEVSRHDERVSASFAKAFTEMFVMLERSLDDAIPAAQRRRLAIAAVAAEIGGIAVSRAIVKNDPDLANEVLDAVRSAIGSAHQAEKKDAVQKS